MKLADNATHGLTIVFKLMLWMNIDKTIVREIIYRKVLFENP